MGRPKKVTVEENIDKNIDKYIDDNVKENGLVETEENVQGNTKVEIINLSTSFKVRNKEGDRLNYVFRGSGKSINDAIKSLKCVSPIEEEGKLFPSDLNLLVTVSVERGEHKFTRALAPHVARATLGKKKNLGYLEKLLGLRK